MTDWDVLRSVRDAYWQALQYGSGHARKVARTLAESYGFANVREMVDIIIREFGYPPLSHGQERSVRPVRRSGAMPLPVC